MPGRMCPRLTRLRTPVPAKTLTSSSSLWSSAPRPTSPRGMLSGGHGAIKQASKASLCGYCSSWDQLRLPMHKKLSCPNLTVMGIWSRVMLWMSHQSVARQRGWFWHCVGWSPSVLWHASLWWPMILCFSTSLPLEGTSSACTGTPRTFI